MKRLAIILALVGEPVGAQAFISGNELHAQCAESDGFGVIECIAYITGVTDQVDLVRRVLGVSTICIPNGVNRGQIKDVVVVYMRDNPHLRHKAGSALVNLALTDAFPCE